MTPPSSTYENPGTTPNRTPNPTQNPTPRVRARTRRNQHSPTATTPAAHTPAAHTLAAPLAVTGVDVARTAGTFTELGIDPRLTAVLARQGIHAPLPIQTATIPDALAGRDILGQVRTGSGKTLAFVLPLITSLARHTQTTAGGRRGTKPSRPHSPRALILAPTRELADQIATVTAPLAAAHTLTVTTVYGGVGYGPQRQALQRGVDIVVACPGRALDLITQGDLHLGKVELVVIDEADHMADQGFLPTVRRILDTASGDAQKLLFSATLVGGVDTLIRQYLTDAAEHTIGDDQAPPPQPVQHRVAIIDDTQRATIVGRLAGDRRTVVFCRTKHRTRQLARKLTLQGHAAVELHGNLSQNARRRNLDAFAAGQVTILVATDIAARGIHVDLVEQVIHADPPIEHTAYTHRSGRTGRAGATGTVTTLASADQTAAVRDLLRKAGITAEWDAPTRPSAGAAVGAAARGSSGRGSAGTLPARQRVRRSRQR